MRGQTHLAVGLGIGIICSLDQSPESIPIIMVTSCIASLAPDLDGNNLLNRHVTKLAKKLKKWGFIAGLLMIILSLLLLYSNENSLPFIDQQQVLLWLGLGVIILGFVFKKQETLKNILMSIIGLALIYYGSKNETWWLVMFALYIGGAGWFSHRGPTHTLWALIYWVVMSHQLEKGMGVNEIALVSSLSYFSHLFCDMLTKRGVKFLYPLSDILFRFRS